MKILLIKKTKFLLSFIIILLIFFLIFYFIEFSPSLAVDFSNNSFFDVDISVTLDNITKSKEKIAYLTFDDGPTLSATSKILDILEEEDVKATFFVVGKHVKENPDLVKREFDEGHYIANHGYSHNNNLLYKSMASFRAEIINTDIEISNAIGIDNYCSHIFRFPNRLYVPH